MSLNQNNFIDPYQNLCGDLRFLNEIEGCYKSISDNMLEINSDKDTNPDFLYRKIENIKSNIGVLKVLLDTLWWDKNDKKRFNKMNKYYKATKKDVWDMIFKLFDEEIVPINIAIADLFYNLWEKIKIIDDQKDNPSDWEELDILFCLIEDEIDNAWKEKELTTFDHMEWMTKLDQAKKYIKHIYI